jgi:hypothetical protein
MTKQVYIFLNHVFMYYFSYLKALRCVEERAREQREEINNELWCMKLNIAYELPPLPKKYVEYMKEAECEDDQVLHNCIFPCIFCNSYCIYRYKRNNSSCVRKSFAKLQTN